MGTDRTFIKHAIYKDLAIFRRMMYYGLYKSNISPEEEESFKDVRSYFKTYFGYDAFPQLETDKRYYDEDDKKAYHFEYDRRLKDSFAGFYSRKAGKPTDFKYYLQLLSNISRNVKYGSEELMGSVGLSDEADLTDSDEETLEKNYAAIQKRFKKLLAKGSELYESGTLVIHSKSPRSITANADLLDGFSRVQKKHFIKALDFGIKKNPFSAFASLYKKTVLCRDGVANLDCGIDFDHQLFHPLLDEINLWSAVEAMLDCEDIGEARKADGSNSLHLIDIQYYNNKTAHALLPLKIRYDATYGRSYLFSYSLKHRHITQDRLDRIRRITVLDNKEQAKETLARRSLAAERRRQAGKAPAKTAYGSDPYLNYSDRRALFLEQRTSLEERLQSAWCSSLKKEKEHVVLLFRNTPALRYRVENEGRHGQITAVEGKRFRFEIDVNDAVEMTNWILNFGEDCKVEAPQRLVNHVVKHLEEMAQ